MPPRARHCDLCECCIDNFDHHCFYIDNCIGKYNLVFFALFLFYFFAVLGFQAYFLVRVILEVDVYEKYSDLLFLLFQFNLEVHVAYKWVFYGCAYVIGVLDIFFGASVLWDNKSFVEVYC